jgi:hypothetical protein
MAYTVALPDGRTVEFPDDLPKDKAAAVIRQQFPNLGAPETTAFGQVKEGVKGILPGAIGLLESAATGASAMLPEDMEKSAREKIKSVATAAKEPFAAAPGYENSVGRRVGEGLGSIIPAAPLGFLGVPGVVAGVGMGLAAGAGESRVRAEAEGATAEQRSKATALGTIPGGFDTAIDMALAALPGGVGKSLSLVRRALASGGVEGATEAAQAIAQNAIAKGVYKPDQALLEGSGEEGAYGAGVGALASVLLDMAIPGRRASGAKTTPDKAPPPEKQPGAQLPDDAAPGTQGTLFSEEEMGKPVREKPEAKAAEPSAAVPEGQQDLGLDYQREYADMAQERERLKQQPQTPEVKARIAELGEQMALYTQSDIESIRAEKGAADARAADEEAVRKKFPALAEAPDLLTQSDEVKARTQGELFPGEDLGTAPAAEPIAEPKLRAKKETGPTQAPLGLRRNPEGQPTTFGEPEPTITSADVMLTAIPVPKGVESWLLKNVVGSTRTQLDALIAKDPTLVQGSTPRAKILRSLAAKDVPAFKEAPRVEPTPTPTPAVEQRDEPRAGKPSVGVPSKPAAPIVPEPGAGVPRAAAEPSAPDGLGLVPAGRPAVQGDETQRAEPAAVTPAPAPVKAAKPAKPAKPAPAPVVEKDDGPKAYEKTPAVALLSRAKTKAQLESALDGIARIRRDPAHQEHDAINEFLTDALAAPGFEPMFTAALDRTRSRQAPPAARVEEEKSADKAKPTRAIPSAFYEPIGFDARTGAVKRGKQMLVQPIDDKRAAEYLKAKERADEGDTSELTALFEEIEQEGEVPDTQSALFDTEGNVTKEGEAKAPPKAEAKPEPKAEAKPEPKAEAKPEPKAEVKAPTIAKWAVDYNAPGFTAVFGDDNIALFRAINKIGNQVYIGVSRARNGRYTNTEIESYTGADFTPEQRDTLLAARAKAVFEESKRAAKNPDGPFTGATSNVAKSDSVEQRYADLLQDLMRSMGLGDVRVFLVHPEDMRGPDAQAKYKLYKSYETAQTAGFSAGEEGSVQPMGPEKRDYRLSFKSGMSENKSIEVITHELGHMIQAIAPMCRRRSKKNTTTGCNPPRARPAASWCKCCAIGKLPKRKCSLYRKVKLQSRWITTGNNLRSGLRITPHDGRLLLTSL